MRKHGETKLQFPPFGGRHAGRIERDAQCHAALQTTIRLVQPDLILRRGFSITRTSGHDVRHPGEVAPGQVLVTQLAGGTVTTMVTATTPSAPRRNNGGRFRAYASFDERK